MGVAAEGTFASLYDVFFDGVLKPIRHKNLEIIQRCHCENIIDLGCGTGSQCRVLTNNGLTVVGLDNSERMLTVAKKKDVNKTRFILGNIMKNDFSDGSFDCAIITLVLHPNDENMIQRILSEAKRLTKKNGIVIITDYDYGNHFKGKIASTFIRFIESMANESHRTNYKGFMKKGGLKDILTTEKYTILESYSLYDNALRICVI